MWLLFIRSRVRLLPIPLSPSLRSWMYHMWAGLVYKNLNQSVHHRPKIQFKKKELKTVSSVAFALRVFQKRVLFKLASDMLTGMTSLIEKVLNQMLFFIKTCFIRQKKVSAFCLQNHWSDGELVTQQISLHISSLKATLPFMVVSTEIYINRLIFLAKIQ